MTKSYKVQLATGAVATIDGVARVEKDGAGLRLYDEAGGVIASWDDGQSKGCWPAEAALDEPEDDAA